ncbi:MAG: acetyl-CoA carboxylase biotin carboxyl carrier protein [Hyphomicrobiaceae bacterium]|nr:acetyl-CoA carboxylase biotin carboxyl carrier protein [Hyphomicrobiaceae bacterium]
MPVSYKDVAEILRIIDASACEEVVLDVDGLRLVVRRGATGGAASTRRPAAPSPADAASPPQPPARSVDPVLAGTAAAPPKQGSCQVTAPMIGTFYRRPSPKAAPFVEVGQRVAKGDPLCLIEVMKLFTTIATPDAGTIEQIAAEDGALVEFGQLLLVIRPD